MKTPSPKRIMIFDLACRDLLACTDLPPEMRERLTALRADVNVLSDNGVDPAKHMPVYGNAKDGASFVVVCSCGEAPRRRPSGHMDMAFYNSHLNLAGLGRNDEYPRFTTGQFAGMTWNEAYKTDSDALIAL